MELTQKQELAFQYIQGELREEEKQIVFDLILTDSVFRELLKEELALRESMKKLHTPIEASEKSRLLAAIKQCAEQADSLPASAVNADPSWLSWSEWTLKLSLPPIIYPIMKNLQRRVFV